MLNGEEKRGAELVRPFLSERVASDNCGRLKLHLLDTPYIILIAGCLPVANDDQ